MVYRIALCEDEEFYRTEMERMLKQYSQKNQDCFEIYTFNSGEALLKQYSEFYFNILLLDVEMDELSGIETAEKIREQDETAFQYIVKPVKFENLSLILDRVLNQIKINTIHNELTEQFISVETINGIIQLNIDDIKYIEKIKNRIDYYTVHGIYQSYDTVKSLIKRLNPLDFVQINQGEIVNWNKVKGISDNIIFVEDVELQISRKNKGKLKERYEKDIMNMMAKSLMNRFE